MLACTGSSPEPSIRTSIAHIMPCAVSIVTFGSKIHERAKLIGDSPDRTFWGLLSQEHIRCYGPIDITEKMQLSDFAHVNTYHFNEGQILQHVFKIDGFVDAVQRVAADIEDIAFESQRHEGMLVSEESLHFEKPYVIYSPHGFVWSDAVAQVAQHRILNTLELNGHRLFNVKVFSMEFAASGEAHPRDVSAMMHLAQHWLKTPSFVVPPQPDFARNFVAPWPEATSEWNKIISIVQTHAERFRKRLTAPRTKKRASPKIALAPTGKKSKGAAESDPERSAPDVSGALRRFEADVQAQNSRQLEAERDALRAAQDLLAAAAGTETQKSPQPTRANNLDIAAPNLITTSTAPIAASCISIGPSSALASSTDPITASHTPTAMMIPAPDPRDLQAPKAQPQVRRDLDKREQAKFEVECMCPCCKGSGQRPVNFDLNECDTKELWIIMSGLRLDKRAKVRTLILLLEFGTRVWKQVVSCLSNIFEDAQSGRYAIRNPSAYLTEACHAIEQNEAIDKVEETTGSKR